MLHELLFHLLDGKNKETILDLLDNDDFIHPGDQEILNQIVSIGSDYRLLQDSHRQITSKCCVYTESDENTENPTDCTLMNTSFADVRPGLYLTAFCNGLDEVLETYRAEIVRLEEVIMENPQLSMGYVLSRAMKFVPLFALMKSMLHMIKLEKVHGCLLVGWLHGYNNYGIQCIVQTANKIQSSVNVIFYKQLANWLICGDLVDEYDEFFIEQSPNYIPNDHSAINNTSTVTLSSTQHGATNTTLDHHSSNRTTTCTLIAATNSQLTRVRTKDGRDPMKRFRLRLGNLPEVIPLSIAEDILFTGQMVWIVREQDSTIDVWQNKSLDLIHSIQHLSTTFHLPSFTATVTRCKTLVSQYLWSIIKPPSPTPTASSPSEDRSLRHHLRLIRDYYCLGRGELFQQYVLAVRDVQQQLPPPVVEASSFAAPTEGGAGDAGVERWKSRRLDGLFHETARRLYGDGDRSHERFRMGAAGEMQFEASWPLDILVFNPATLQHYTRIFQFLLRIQRTQSHLHQLWWTQHRTTKSKSTAATSSRASSIAGSAAADADSCWSLRHNLQFVVDNLQYYLHVDVIESEFSRFEHSLDGASSTSDVTSLHSAFLSGLLSRTFVMGSLTSTSTSSNPDQSQSSTITLNPTCGKNDRMVYNIICHLLDLCDEFCSAISAFDGVLDSHTLEPFQQRFQTMMEMLLRTLYSLHEKVSSGYHVLQLLHRLDFNRWYTQTLSASDLNLTKLRI